MFPKKMSIRRKLFWAALILFLILIFEAGYLIKILNNEHKVMNELYQNQSQSQEENRLIRQEGNLSKMQKHAFIQLVLLFGFGLAGTGFIFLLLDKNVINPISKTAKAMIEIQKGNYAVELTEQGSDEVAVLVSSYSKMVESLRLDKLSLDFLKNAVTSNDPEKLVKSIIEELVKNRIICGCAYYSYNEGEESLDYLKGIAVKKEFQHTFKLEQGIVGKIASQKEIRKISNKKLNLFREAAYNTAFPLYYKDRLIGLMIIGSMTELTGNQLNKFSQLLAQLAIILKNIDQFHQNQFLIKILTYKNEELNERKKYAEALLRNSAEGIFSIDQHHMIQSWSRGAEEITGYNKKEVIGKNSCYFLKFIDKQGNGLCNQGPNCFLKQQRFVKGKEVNLQLKDGSIIPIQISVSGFYDSQQRWMGAVIVFRDVSKEKANLLKIKTANKVKSEFLATMSHELRTPLNSILGFSELLENEVIGEMNEKQHRFITNIRQGGEQLLSLLNDILDISRIEAGNMEWEASTINLAQTLENSVMLVKGMAKDKKIKLKSEIEETGLEGIECDERKIKQIVHNLLINAIKFTPTEGEVGLKVYREKDFVYITVWDSGIGIPSEKLKYIFNPFVQLDSSLARKYEGTGLGLSLVKELVQLGSGEIKVTSELDIGSKFTVKLPVNITTGVLNNNS